MVKLQLNAFRYETGFGLILFGIYLLLLALLRRHQYQAHHGLCGSCR